MGSLCSCFRKRRKGAVKWDAHPILRLKDTHVISVGRSERTVAFAKADSESEPSSCDEFLHKPVMDELETEPVLLT